MKTNNLEKKQIDLIKKSIAVWEMWVQCRSLFHGSELSFTDIESFVDDRGNSPLFHLKEMSHELYRNSEYAHYKEKLFDITVGYIFHEAMKLRENAYQLEYYRPQYDITHHRLTEQEKKIVNEIGHFVKKADSRLKEGFKEIRTLLNEMIGQVRDLIVLYKNNYLLPRFVFENEKALIRMYGKKGFANILNSLYSDGRRLLILKAGESYLESQYYDTARLLFKKVLRFEGENAGALFLYTYSSAQHFYFKNMFTRALMLARKAEGMQLDDKTARTYAEPLKKLIADVSKEIKRQKTE